MNYSGKRVLITGGLGFIGSNLAIRAVELGAEVTIVDSSVAGCGANPYNIEPVKDRVRVIPLDVGQAEQFREEVARTNVVFNLAGEISHSHSMEYPERDLEINTVSQLRFLNVCKSHNRGVRIVYAGTRQIYGVPEYLPVDEAHSIHPVDFNGVHKHAATLYHEMMSRGGHLDAVVLRLTNVYGPRMALSAPCQGFIGTFFRRMVLGHGLLVYGDGSQQRDLLYVDDAVEAFLMAGTAAPLRSRTYNLGGPEALSLMKIAGICSEAAGGHAPEFRPFPKEQKEIDIGSYCADWGLIRRELGWTPKVRLTEGVRRTLEFFRAERTNYLESDDPSPPCKLAHAAPKTRLVLV